MTKMMQQSCNDAPKVLNDGMINGENGGMVEWWNGENAAVDDIHLQ